jgi:guanylate kinase
MIFVISGPSGVGKGTLIQAILHQHPCLCMAVSATTRQPRIGERDGVEYHFLSQTKFDEHIQNRQFLEWCNVHGNRYGTLKPEVIKKLSTYRAIIVEIDVQGAEKIRKNNDFPQFHIFIAPPSEEVLEARLKSRNTENDDVIQQRLLEAKRELLKKDHYDKIIVNNELTQSIDELNNVILRILTKEPST